MAACASPRYLSICRLHKIMQYENQKNNKKPTKAAREPDQLCADMLHGLLPRPWLFGTATFDDSRCLFSTSHSNTLALDILPLPKTSFNKLKTFVLESYSVSTKISNWLLHLLQVASEQQSTVSITQSNKNSDWL